MCMALQYALATPGYLASSDYPSLHYYPSSPFAVPVVGANHTRCFVFISPEEMGLANTLK